MGSGIYPFSGGYDNDLPPFYIWTNQYSIFPITLLSTGFLVVCRRRLSHIYTKPTKLRTWLTHISTQKYDSKNMVNPYLHKTHGARNMVDPFLHKQNETRNMVDQILHKKMTIRTWLTTNKAHWR